MKQKNRKFWCLLTAGIVAGICLAGWAGAYLLVHNSLSGYQRLSDKTVSVSWEEKPFLCYLSGIEGKEVLSEKEVRYSDVNLLAAVDPKKHTILLVNTPRDTLLTVPETAKAGDAAGAPEKLDAMPLYGKRASIKALSSFYDTQIDCSVQVNYNVLKRVVNTLGGVDVYSECDFESDWGPSFKKGRNHVNGKQALAFVRERHHLPDGDVQRGRNQQYMLQAILDRVKSQKSLLTYYELLKCTKNGIVTDLSAGSLEKLLKWQYKDRKKWKIERVTLQGEQSAAVTNSSEGQEIYAYLPSAESQKDIREQLNKILSD